MRLSNVLIVATLISTPFSSTQQAQLTKNITIEQFAQKFATTTDRIRQLNHLVKTPLYFKENQTIKLPSEHILMKPKDQSLAQFLTQQKIDFHKIKKYNPFPFQNDSQYIAVSEKGMAHLELPSIFQLFPPQSLPYLLTKRVNSQTLHNASIKNAYTPGQCTAYIYEQRVKRHLPISRNWGHAKFWLFHAQQEGYTISKYPRVNAILVSQQGTYGHVAIVEACDQNKIHISEMNWKGQGIISHRVIPYSDDYQYIY
ncbi:CHAP domain-containing protein [Staphylococcus sp. IVB6246]|uniref:CHAP domain-containing protein n=1 Tax=Staphylococcus sp. IVB6246 TaxID=2989772 RepID=UPI0021D18FCC|nr:CHAP domain-containing protein [Staphylococcus sp. IVB6246]UXR69999.1 CHAP domain-containing protein [Staphylococcus sp. IVB6246]